MALNPDDLLIFKEREEKSEKKMKKAVKEKPVQAQKKQSPPEVQKPAPQPKETPIAKPEVVQQPKEVPTAKTEVAQQPKEIQTAKPKVVQQPKEIQTTKPKAVQQPQAMLAPKPQEKAVVRQQPKPQPNPQPKQPAAEQEINRESVVQPVRESPPTESVESIYSSLQPSEEEIESIISGEFAHGGGPVKKSTISRTEEQSRDAAKGKSCVWHPWRPAYALCNYCNRPFCYEDIIEYKNNYYCLEDIDKVSTGAGVETTVRYNRLSMLSALLFIIAFVVFVFSAIGQVAYITNYANKIGFFSFIAQLNYAYTSALLGFFLALFSIIAGILIFVHSDKGFMVGSLVGAFSTILFSYSYISSGAVYTIAISLVSFAALVLLLLSRETYEAEESLIPARSYQQAEVPVGRF